MLWNHQFISDKYAWTHSFPLNIYKRRKISYMFHIFYLLRCKYEMIINWEVESLDRNNILVRTDGWGLKMKSNKWLLLIGPVIVKWGLSRPQDYVIVEIQERERRDELSPADRGETVSDRPRRWSDHLTPPARNRNRNTFIVSLCQTNNI